MNAATEVYETFVAPAATTHPVRPFYWSVRRELWKKRSLLIAPLLPAGLALLVLIYRALTIVPTLVLGLATIAAWRWLGPGRSREGVEPVAGNPPGG